MFLLYTIPFMSNYYFHLSKSLSWLLRHGAVKNNLTVSPDGYILVDDIKKLTQFKDYELSDFKYVTNTNDKKRFTMKEENGIWYIRANQGHSAEVGTKINQEELLKKLTEPIDPIIHGTSYQAYRQIKQTGLNKMGRTHIHFAITDDFVQGNQQQSGIRSNCQIMLYVDMASAMKDGYEFFMSDNKVVLSPGDANGIIPFKYVTKAIDRANGKTIE